MRLGGLSDARYWYELFPAVLRAPCAPEQSTDMRVSGALEASLSSAAPRGLVGDSALGFGSLLTFVAGVVSSGCRWGGELRSADLGHRHLSHLYPLHPGAEIDPIVDVSAAAAARAALEQRCGELPGAESCAPR